MGGEIKCGPKTDRRPGFRLIAGANCVCLYGASTLFNFCLTGKTNECSGICFVKDKIQRKLEVRFIKWT